MDKKWNKKSTASHESHRGEGGCRSLQSFSITKHHAPTSRSSRAKVSLALSRSPKRKKTTERIELRAVGQPIASASPPSTFYLHFFSSIRMSLICSLTFSMNKLLFKCHPLSTALIMRKNPRFFISIRRPLSSLILFLRLFSSALAHCFRSFV